MFLMYIKVQKGNVVVKAHIEYWKRSIDFILTYFSLAEFDDWSILQLDINIVVIITILSHELLVVTYSFVAFSAITKCTLVK